MSEKYPIATIYALYLGRSSVSIPIANEAACPAQEEVSGGGDRMIVTYLERRRVYYAARQYGSKAMVTIKGMDGDDTEQMGRSASIEARRSDGR